MRGIWVVCDLNYFTAIGHFFFFSLLANISISWEKLRIRQIQAPSFSLVCFPLEPQISFLILMKPFSFFVLPKQFFFSI